MFRFKQICLGILLIFSFSLIASAQVEDEKKFAQYKWDKFDFTKKKVTKAQLDKLKYYGDDPDPIDELAVVRGILFGKRGRIVVRDIEVGLDGTGALDEQRDRLVL